MLKNNFSYLSSASGISPKPMEEGNVECRAEMNKVFYAHVAHKVLPVRESNRFQVPDCSHISCITTIRNRSANTRPWCGHAAFLSVSQSGPQKGGKLYQLRDDMTNSQTALFSV